MRADKLALQSASGRLGGLDLPLALVIFTVAVRDGAERMVFFYPDTTPADRLLRVFKDQTARAYL